MEMSIILLNEIIKEEEVMVDEIIINEHDPVLPDRYLKPGQNVTAEQHPALFDLLKNAVEEYHKEEDVK